MPRLHPNNTTATPGYSLMAHDITDEQLKDLINRTFAALGAAPYICKSGHVHGEPLTHYTVQLVARDPADHDDVCGVLSFDVLTDEHGATHPLNLAYGQVLDTADIRLELLHENNLVWSQPWRTAEDRKAKLAAGVDKQRATPTSYD